jgi:hypothetical protein
MERLADGPAAIRDADLAYATAHHRHLADRTSDIAAPKRVIALLYLGENCGKKDFAGGGPTGAHDVVNFVAAGGKSAHQVEFSPSPGGVGVRHDSADAAPDLEDQGVGAV